jgi:CRISPR-associated protein Csc1
MSPCQEMQKTQKNIPSFGRAKEIAPESQFEFFVISEKALTFPHWIRLGKWMSKAEIKVDDLGQPKQKQGEINCPYPLNPLDVMFTHRVISYDVINMPPVSLIRNVKLEGFYYQTGDIKLPARMSYRFSN